MDNIVLLFTNHGIDGLVILALLVAYGLLVRSMQKKSVLQISAFSILGAFLIIIFTSKDGSLSTHKSQREAVTIEKANSLMERLTSAISRKDVDSVINLISEEATIEISNTDGEKKLFSRSDYKTYLSNVFHIPSKFNLKNIRTDQFLIKGGEQVISSNLVIEKVGIGTFYEEVLSQQIFIIENRNGLPIIIFVGASQVRRTNNPHN